MLNGLKMEKIGAATNYGGSVTAVASSVVWGMTQAEWLIFTSIVGVLFGAIGLVIQFWVSWNKVRAYRAEVEAINRGERIVVRTKKGSEDGEVQ